MTEHPGLRHKISDFIQDHKVISIIVALGLLAGVYYEYTNIKTSNTPVRYGVTQVQKGTLVVSVAGSGQVLASSQVDINPKVSGTITDVLVKEGDAVKEGQVIAKLDATDAQKAVRDAQLNLQSAQVALSKLTEPPDKLALVQAQNSYASAQRALKLLTDPPDTYTLTAAQNDVSSVQLALQLAQNSITQQSSSDNQSLQSANDDAYNSLSTAFFDATTFINDLYSVQDNSKDLYTGNHISSYELILGKNSPLITTYLNDYTNARQIYDTTFAEYQGVSRNADQATLYKLLSDSVAMERAISQNLEDVRNMFNAIVNADYKSYSIAPTVDQLKPVIESDITTMNRDLADVQTKKDSIDTLNLNIPLNTQKNQNALVSAQETLTAKQEYLAKLIAGPKPEDVANAQDNVNQTKAALDKLQQGADKLDVQNQKLVVQQRQNALKDAQDNLAKYSVTSPFDGIVAKVTSVIGGAALSGQGSASSTNVATIITSDLLAQVSLNEVDAAKVKIGDKATLTFDAVPDITIAGQLVQLDTIGTSSSGVVSYNAKIAFNAQDPRVKPGMSATAAIVTQVDQDVLLVPNAAVKTQGTTSYVSVFDTSMVTPNATDSTTGTVVTLQQPQRVTVQTSASNDTSTEITNGLQEGQFVVTQTMANVAAGTSAGTSAAGGGAAGGGAGIRIPGLGGGGFGGRGG